MDKRALCLTFFLLFSIVFCENIQLTKKPLTILAYLKSFKNGQTLKIPAFLISPIIIVPKENKEHNTDGQGISSVENFEGNGEIFKKIIPMRIILNDTSVNEQNNDIEVSFRQALNRGSLDKSNVKENKTSDAIQTDGMSMAETITVATNTTNTDNKTTTSVTTTVAEHNVTELTSTEASDLNLTGVSNSQAINTLTITDGPSNSFLLPPLIDEEWKNFTVTANINITKPNNTESTETSNNITLSPSVNVTDSTIKGPYPAALYHNAEIDQVSITTNSYTNESPLPPRQDDRWRSFSSLGQMILTSSEFRPLAGLYYDGFLHRPLPNKNPGFAPYNRYFLY